ncbi:uncharacterized protein BN688_02833 [[Clostridium] clostridioforme CAG:511]|nr:uncharacterized protein BN688_02833 [[Clostridium] clostridioforme CAG:511]
MKAENTGIPKLGHAFSFIPLPKGMGRVVYHFQPVLPGYGLNPFHIAQVSVHMDRHNGRGLIRNQSLDFFRVHGVILRIDVAEYRGQVIAHNGMGGGRKAEGSGNHLAGQLQGLDGHFQGHVPVYKKHHVPDSHVLLKLLFQLFVEISHVSQPCAVPYGFYHLYIFFVRRKGGPGNQYLLLFIFLSVHTSFCPFCRPHCISKPACAPLCVSIPACAHRPTTASRTPRSETTPLPVRFPKQPWLPPCPRGRFPDTPYSNTACSCEAASAYPRSV